MKPLTQPLASATVTHTRRRDFYYVRAFGWPKRRRVNPTIVRTYCNGYEELARVVLWLETMGYRCRIYRSRLRY